MLDAVTGLLACPHCGAELDATGAPTVFSCVRGHAFDVGRPGYLNLSRGPAPAHADTAAMVAARERFLATGAYDRLRDALVARVAGGVVVDAGAGPAWYLAGALDADPDRRGLGLDISAAAVRRAARRHPRLGAVVADAWVRWPVRDEVADTVLSVFAPRNPAEAARVLRPGGRLVIAAAEPDHLHELRARAGLLEVEPDKERRLVGTVGEHLTITENTRLSFALDLEAGPATDLVAMGPNAFHADPDRPSPGGGRVTVAVRLLVARR